MKIRSIAWQLLVAWVCGAAGMPDAAAATTCSASMTPLSFGSVNVNLQSAATATLTVTCRTGALSLLGNVKVRMCLNIGRATDPRSMPNAQNDMLGYQLYQDATYSNIWVSSTGTAPAIQPYQLDLSYDAPILGGSTTRNITLYGRIPPQGSAAAGTYTQSYTGANTSVAFRYNEPVLFLPTAYPSSCTIGGTAGADSAFPFAVNATVAPSCEFSGTTNLDFGSQAGAISSARDNIATITMNCRNRTAWNLGLENGQNFGDGTRRMQLGATGNYVGYQLYRDVGRSAVWGNTIGVDTVAGTGNGTPQTHTVYGRVPAPQNAPAGNYKDTVTVTVTY